MPPSGGAWWPLPPVRGPRALSPTHPGAPVAPNGDGGVCPRQGAVGRRASLFCGWSVVVVRGEVAQSFGGPGQRPGAAPRDLRDRPCARSATWDCTQEPRARAPASARRNFVAENEQSPPLRLVGRIGGRCLFGCWGCPGCLLRGAVSVAGEHPGGAALLGCWPAASNAV